MRYACFIATYAPVPTTDVYDADIESDTTLALVTTADDDTTTGYDTSSDRETTTGYGTEGYETEATELINKLIRLPPMSICQILMINLPWFGLALMYLILTVEGRQGMSDRSLS